MGIKSRMVSACFGVMICLGEPSYAELLIDPVGKNDVGKGEIGAFIGNSTTEYSYSIPSELVDYWDLDSDESTTDIKRQYVSVYFAYGLSKNIDIFGVGGYVFNAESKDGSSSTSGGSGFLVGGGVRGSTDFNVMPGIDVYWYTQFLMYNEDYGTQHIEIANFNFEGSIKELSIGAVAKKSIEQGIILYAGPEFVFFKDGDLDWSASTIDYKKTEGYERDNAFGLRLGAKKQFGELILSINAALMNESSFSIGVNVPFGK